MIKKLLTATCAAAIGAVTATSAFAHATSIGYENAGVAGSVNIWLGTYSSAHGASSLEGSMNLMGVNGNPYASTTMAFSLAAGDANGSGTWTGITGYQANKPAGLVDGTTNWYGCRSSVVLIDTDTCGASDSPTHWQGATFAGLAAGDYQFTWIPRAVPSPTAQWSVSNPSMNGIFTISGTVVTGNVPLPAGMPLLIAGVGAFGFLRNKKRKAA